MKTYLRTIMAAMAIAGVSAERIAVPAAAQGPGCFGSQCAVGGTAGEQPLPSFPGGPAYGPYAYPGGPAWGAGPCLDGCGPAGSCDGCGCCEESSGCFGTSFLLLACAGQWRLSADAVLLRRSSPKAQTLFRGGFGNTSAITFDAESLSFDMQPGFSVTATRAGAIGLDVELNYTQVDAFRSSTTLSGDTFMEADDTGSDASVRSVKNPQIENTSQLRSGEGNFGWHVGEQIRLLGGFRWIEFRDHYGVNSLGGIIIPPVPVTLNNDALNDLYGGQIGADLTLLDWERIVISAGGKAGVYGNACRQTSRLVDTGFIDQEIGTHSAHPAFVGEINVLGTVEVYMDRLFLRAGYQALWIDGVLLAPEQINVNNFATSMAGLRFDTLFIHGLHAGLELRY